MVERMSGSLQNYIRSYRRKANLSQEEVAFLLGHSEGTGVLRHEDFQRVPSLELGLTYAVIFRVDAREVFAGHHEQVEKQVRQRAAEMLARIDSEQEKHSEAKLTHLQLLAGSSEPYLVPCEE